MLRILPAAAALMLASSGLSAPSISRLNSPLPLWADSALAKAGFWSGYDFSSRTSSEVEFGDLDGDGLRDVAIAVVDKGGRRRGLAIVHQIDRSVHIVGAGQPLGNGRDQFSEWGLGRLIGHRAGVRVLDWHETGWIVWNGQSYVWLADSD